MSHLTDIGVYASPETVASNSAKGHQVRALMLAAILQHLGDTTLPEVDSWSNSARGHIVNGHPGTPALTGHLYNCWTLSEARTSVGAWAAALGVEIVETLKGSTLTVAAWTTVQGVDIGVTTWLNLGPACPDCGGPGTRTEVYRHYADTCGGTR